MGNWFSNFHIRKNECVNRETVIDCLKKYMAARKYIPTEDKENADVEIAVVSSEGCPWVSVYSDALRHDDSDSCAQIAAPISEELQTDVLGIACFDSDFLYLNLINVSRKLDGWVGIGSAEDVGIKRRNKLTPWKKKVTDYAAFAEISGRSYLVADEYLLEAESFLELPASLSTASVEHLQEMNPEARITSLYFATEDDAQKEGGVHLEALMKYALPCLSDMHNVMTVYNFGTASRGLSVRFLGPYVENDEITFSEVYLSRGYVNCEGYIKKYVELTKEQLPDGEWAYCYHDPDFEILPAVPRRMEKRKRETEFEKRKLYLHFIPYGNPRKMLDVTIVVTPDENPSNRAEWNIWKEHGSKKAFIEHHNKIWRRIQKIEGSTKGCYPIFKETDFD